MGNFLLALAIVAGGWWLLRKIGSAQPAKMRGLVRSFIGGAIMVVAGILMFRGAMNVAIPLFILGAGMVGETSLFPQGIEWPGAKPGSGPPPPAQSTMTREEALAVLGLKPGANAEEIRLAHRRLIKDYHPDKGGSDYLAVKINQAKELLLQELGATT
jgi:hypothetical protein